MGHTGHGKNQVLGTFQVQLYGMLQDQLTEFQNEVI